MVHSFLVQKFEKAYSIQFFKAVFKVEFVDVELARQFRNGFMYFYIAYNKIVHGPAYIVEYIGTGLYNGMQVGPQLQHKLF